MPAGLVYYQNREYPINLLKNEFGKSLEMNINNSIELLEYEIGNVIRKCVQEKKLKLAFLEGHDPPTSKSFESRMGIFFTF